jgi:hypothetical protein
MTVIVPLCLVSLPLLLPSFRRFLMCNSTALVTWATAIGGAAAAIAALSAFHFVSLSERRDRDARAQINRDNTRASIVDAIATLEDSVLGWRTAMVSHENMLDAADQIQLRRNQLEALFDNSWLSERQEIRDAYLDVSSSASDLGERMTGSLSSSDPIPARGSTHDDTYSLSSDVTSLMQQSHQLRHRIFAATSDPSRDE